VGGAVRDELLGLAIADRDWVVTGATVADLLAQAYKPVGQDFPCFLHPETKEEYALARAGSRPLPSGSFAADFSPEICIEDDLLHRDLTINAIAKNAEGEYIDPYGGREDLKAGILRHVSETFSDDPLRILRVARFAARYHCLNFKVHQDTLALMTQLVANGKLAQLRPERVWKELSRALAESKPSVFFMVLRACGALKVLLPELDCLFGVPQPPQHHPEVDTGVHVMMVTDIAKKLFDSPIVTWAALMHDLGKGVTPQEDWPRHLLHEIKGVPLVEAVSERFKIPNDFKELAMKVSEHHLRCHKILEMKPRTIMRLLEALDAVRRPERLEQFAQACEADSKGRLGFEDRPYPASMLLVGCTEAAGNIDIQPLLEAGHEGLTLAELIRRLRITAIARYMAAYRNLKC